MQRVTLYKLSALKFEEIKFQRHYRQNINFVKVYFNLINNANLLFKNLDLKIKKDNLTAEFFTQRHL